MIFATESVLRELSEKEKLDQKIRKFSRQAVDAAELIDLLQKPGDAETLPIDIEKSDLVIKEAALNHFVRIGVKSKIVEDKERRIRAQGVAEFKALAAKLKTEPQILFQDLVLSMLRESAPSDFISEARIADVWRLFSSLTEEELQKNEKCIPNEATLVDIIVQAISTALDQPLYSGFDEHEKETKALNKIKKIKQNNYYKNLQPLMEKVENAYITKHPQVKVAVT